MTNVFGPGAPVIGVVDTDDHGPLQIEAFFSCPVPMVITHMRYYVATTTLAAEVSGAMDYQVWLTGEPGSVVTGTLTIPGSTGWVVDDLSAPLHVPAGRWVAAAISFPAVTPISYGSTLGGLPVQTELLRCEASRYFYQAETIVTVKPWVPLPSQLLTWNYFIDVEAAMAEFIIPNPLDLVEDDVIEIRSHVRGVVNTVTPITDAVTVNLTVEGGPLDGTDVDFWVPDTAGGLAAADMQLYQEVDDPPIPSFWQTPDGAKWAYRGGGVYICVVAGESFPIDALTTRATTPTLVAYP